MLHARIEVAQILDIFQVRCVIHEFAPGTDPVIWSQHPLTIPLPGELEDASPLSTVIALISLWSEMTISD